MSFKIVNIFLPISFNICFGCSKEPSQCDGSFEYPQHMFWLRKRKLYFDYAPLTTCMLSLSLNSLIQFETVKFIGFDEQKF